MIFAIAISIVLGITIYFSKISKIGFETFCENMDIIDNYIYEKTGFKKIQANSNINEYYYEKNINNKSCHICFNISCERWEYFGSTVWHKANIDIIANSSNDSFKMSNSFQVQELINKYPFLALDNKLNIITSSLIFLTSSHKLILAYMYSIISFTNDLALLDNVIKERNI